MTKTAHRRQHRQAAGAAAAEGQQPVEGPAPPQPWPLVRLGRVATWPPPPPAAFSERPPAYRHCRRESTRDADIAKRALLTQRRNFELCYPLCREAVLSSRWGSGNRQGAALPARSDTAGLWEQNGGGRKSWRLNTWLSLFAAPHIASDGNVIAKEAEHFPSRVRPSRIGIGSGGTATRPSVAGSVDAPLL